MVSQFYRVKEEEAFYGGRAFPADFPGPRGDGWTRVVSKTKLSIKTLAQKAKEIDSEQKKQAPCSKCRKSKGNNPCVGLASDGHYTWQTPIRERDGWPWQVWESLHAPKTKKDGKPDCPAFEEEEEK